jgi:hypothetical protein
VAWVFFRATSLQDAWYVLSHLTANLPAQLSAVISGASGARAHLIFLDFERSRVGLAVLSVLFLLLIERRQKQGSIRARVALAPPSVRWAAYSAAVLAIMTLGVFGSAKFIYFQF